jgi:hypothetical protein
MKEITELSFSDVTDRLVGLSLEKARIISLLWRNRPTGRFIAKVPQNANEERDLVFALRRLRGENTHGEHEDNDPSCT